MPTPTWFGTLWALALATWSTAQAHEFAADRPPEVVVLGRVMNPDGTPCAKARVQLLQTELPGTPVSYTRLGEGPVRLGARTTTDHSGRFRLQLPTTQEVGIVAFGPNDQISEVIAPVAPGATYTLTLRNTRLLHGTVTETRGEETRPSAGTEVWVEFPNRAGAVVRDTFVASCLSKITRTRTAADGSFSLRVPARTADCVRTPGFVKSPYSPETERLEIQREFHRVEVRVLDASTEQPLAGATTATAATPSDADGRLAAWLISPFPVPLCKAGYLPGLVSRHTIKTVRLQTSANVELRLLAPDGKPVAGAELLAGYRTNSASVGAWLTEVHTSDEDGRLSVPRPMQGAVTLWQVERSPKGTRCLRILAVPSGESALDVGDVQLRTFSVRGVVLEPNGVPAAHSPIHVLPSEDLLGGLRLSTHPFTYTDHAGRFSLSGLPAYAHELATYSALSAVTIHGPFDPRPGQERPKLRIQLQPAIVLRGTLRGASGAPRPGQRVATSCNFGGSPPEFFRFGIVHREVQTDGQGRFAVPALDAELPHKVYAVDDPRGGLTVSPPAERIELVK